MQSLKNVSEQNILKEHRPTNIVFPKSKDILTFKNAVHCRLNIHEKKLHNQFNCRHFTFRSICKVLFTLSPLLFSIFPIQ